MRQYDSTPAPEGGRRGVFRRACPMVVLAVFRQTRKLFSSSIGGKAQGWSFIVAGSETSVFSGVKYRITNKISPQFGLVVWVAAFFRLRLPMNRQINL
jgi:hypothetical protein